MDTDRDAEDREILFGLVALRLGLVERPALGRALTSWSSARGKPLSRHLVDRGLISPERIAKVEAVAAQAIQSHGGDLNLAVDSAGPPPLVQELRAYLAPAGFDTINDEAGYSRAADPAQDGSLAAALLDTHRGPASSTGQAPAADLYATLADTEASVSPVAAAPDTVAGTPTPRPTPASASARSGSGSGSGMNGGANGSETLAEAASALRYRIIKLHAKGGLGQVFVARDEELNREVALKEIQGRHADNVESRTRFLVEAEVTGNLEHPGIVPVYGLGRYPDGRPYYAMRFVRGESMKEAVDRYHEDNARPDRDPGAKALALRKLLAQLVDVCNAMAYAHSRGVLHRDLKPANVMLGSFGETLVVDWGLAKFQDAPEGAPADRISGLIRPMSAGSSSQTLFGSAVGTPQFMSPEQAAGKLDEIGPASDIYSLGAILYTILVGKPPFLERDLNVMLEKVRKGDFPSPRSKDPTAPAALNAVCLKAMALRPADRYPSARALADDVEHWMADEPVSVYREPALVRVARWARRHKTAVAAASALLVTALLSLAVYSVLIRREQARTEHFYLMARRAVDKMLTELGDDQLANVPQMEPVRARMLGEAKAFYEELRKARAGDPRATRDLALAVLRLGDIEALLGDPNALPRYDDAVAQLRARLKTTAGDRDARTDLARALHARGLLLRKLNRLDDVERDLSEALALRDGLAGERGAGPDAARDRTDTLYQLAALHDRRGKTAEARKEYDRVIDSQKAIADAPGHTLDDRRRLGRYTNNLANLVKRGGSDALKVAQGLYESALAIQQDVVKLDPVTAFYRYELAKTHGNLRIVLASEGDVPGAETHAIEDVTLSRRLADDFRHVPEYRNKLATARSNLGELRFAQKRYPEAADDLDGAVALADDLVKAHGDQRDYRSVLAAALVNRGNLREATGKEADALADLARARDALLPIGTGPNATPEDLFDLGTVDAKLARAHARAGRLDEALKDLDAAIPLHERAAALGRAEDGGSPRLWLDLSLQFDVLKLKKDYARCAEVGERLTAVRPTYGPSYVLAAQMLAFVCDSTKGDDPASHERALDYARRALKQLREAARRNLLKPEEIEKAYYRRPRQLIPEGFDDLAEVVRRQTRI